MKNEREDCQLVIEGETSYKYLF